jgi:hypothetical protein
MKIRGLVFIIIALISGCSTTGGGGDLWMIFYPRQCKALSSSFIRLIEKQYNNITYYELDGVYPSDSCTAKMMAIEVSTSNLDTTEGYKLNDCHLFYGFHETLDESIQNLDDHNTALEQQMRDDYQSDWNTLKSGNTVAEYPNYWEYRTTGVTAFSITSNKTLFGKVPGTSLNGYFYIHDLYRHQIISYETRELIFGYSDDLDQMGLAEWLDMKPMAQPTMYLRLNSTPPEVPDTVNFTIHIITTSGLNLELTTQDIVLVE